MDTKYTSYKPYLVPQSERYVRKDDKNVKCYKIVAVPLVGCGNECTRRIVHQKFSSERCLIAAEKQLSEIYYIIDYKILLCC